MTPTATRTPGSSQGDREALIALYNATDGANWKESGHWLSNEGLDSWHGVTTKSEGRVTRINLNANDLSGALPSLSALTELEHLNLRQNQLSGPVPELGDLTELLVLNLSFNDLSGEIPDLSP